jgi:hypothetical protein
MESVNPEAQADQLADLFRQLSVTLDEFRAAHMNLLSGDQSNQLADNAQRLDDFAEQFTGQAIAETLASIQGNINNITAAMKDAQRAVNAATKVERVASLAAAAIALGGSIAAGKFGTILSAVGFLSANAFSELPGDSSTDERT